MLIPINRHLLVAPADEDAEKPSVLIPAGVQVKPRGYKPYQIVQRPNDSKLQKGEVIIVPDHMVEQLECFGKTYYLVLENHVVAIYQPED